MDIKLIIFLVLQVTIYCIVSGKNCPNPPNVLNTQGKGVDVTKLDMYPLNSGSSDNGFRNLVVDYTCNQSKKWKTYDLPDQVENIADHSSGLIVDEVEVMKSSTDVTKTFAANAGITVLSGIFSASGSYETMQRTLTQESKYILEASSSLSTLTSDLKPHFIIGLGSSAKVYVDNYLPNSLTSSNIDEFNTFIRYYGTHYCHHAKFGGRIRMHFATDKTYFEKHSDKKVKAEAKATFLKKFSINGGGSSSTNRIDKKITQATRNTVRYYGGDTNLLSQKYGVDKWQPTVAGKPWLIGCRLEPIYGLFRQSNKRMAMKKAVQVHLDKAYLRELLRILPRSTSQSVRQYRSQINALLSAAIPNHSRVVSLGKTIETAFVVPTWFSQNTQLCYNWYADGDGGQCGGGVRNTLCAKPGEMTPYYRDDTDRRGGGCRMRWGIMSPSADKPSWFNSVRVCYRWYPDGDGGQCGGGARRLLCANINSWTPYYRDDTDRRGGGCRMSWRLIVPNTAPAWMKSAKLCFYWYPDGDGGQCGGGGGLSRRLCASANTWTPYYRDDTDRRSGGCRMSWGIKV